jgi:hypothetical protein
MQDIKEKSFKKKTTPRIKVIHKRKVLYKKKNLHTHLKDYRSRRRVVDKHLII